MKDKVFGAVVAVVLSTLVYGVAWTYGQKKSIDERGWKADICHAYLTEPIVKTDKGETLTRAQLLDLIVKQSLQPKK